MLPIGHSYIETFFEYSESFGGGNRILVVLENKEGDIFQKDFLYKLNDITQDLFYIPGVARHTVTSLWTPNTRFIAVTEEGLEAGDVIPANFAGTEEDIDTVLQNTLRADLVGRLVSTDFQGAMIRAELLDFNPETQQRLDYFEVARKLETELRDKYVTDTTDVKIVGFAKLTGDIADGASSVVFFFSLAFVLTCFAMWLYCRSWILTAVTVGASLCSLVWQFGLLHMLGFGLDPLGVLVPFLVFAIGVSHGVQQINTSIGGRRNSKVVVGLGARHLHLFAQPIERWIVRALRHLQDRSLPCRSCSPYNRLDRSRLQDHLEPHHAPAARLLCGAE